MIRINLVPGERRPLKGAKGAWNVGQKVTLAGSLVLMIATLLVGWRYWSLGEQEAQMTRDIEAARREETRLAEVLKQVAAFETQRAQLQQRVSLIDELRRGQTAPVHIVDQISRALPEMTWLVSLKQDGYDITIEGRSTTHAALSDFIGNLEGTRYFKRPVEIVESEVVKAQQDAQDLIGFTIKGTFQMAGIEPAPAKGTGKAPAKTAAARGGTGG
jgi:type IV pilus assembly protein PilN